MDQVFVLMSSCETQLEPLREQHTSDIVQEEHRGKGVSRIRFHSAIDQRSKKIEMAGDITKSQSGDK